MLLGVSQSYNFLKNQVSKPSAVVTIPGSLFLGMEADGSYVYSSSTSLLEQNKPPYSNELVKITGTFLEGSTLTAVIDTLVIPNGQSVGTHIVKWFRCGNKKQDFEVIIDGAVTLQYVLTNADVGNYIRCEVTLTQTNGNNLTGEVLYSLHTDLVHGLTFNPITDISWDSAYMHNDLVLFDQLKYWLNRGSVKKNAVQDGTNALPIYDLSRQALDFTRASSQRLLFTKRNPAWAAPFEMWFRFRLKQLTGNQQIIAFTSSAYLLITSAGALNLSGSIGSSGVISANTWYTIRVVYNGASSTIEVNNGSPATFNAVATIGTGSARIGCAFSQSNFIDGYIKDIFIVQGNTTSQNQIDMWTWFSNN